VWLLGKLFGVTVPSWTWVKEEVLGVGETLQKFVAFIDFRFTKRYRL